MAEGSTYDTYTTFSNPDKKLKKQIADFKIDANKVTMGWPSKVWDIIEYEKDEVKCQNGRNVQFFLKKEVAEALNNELERERNNAYPAFKYFKNCFGVISELFENKKEGWGNLKIIDLRNCNDFLGAAIGMKRTTVDTMEVQGYETFYTYQISPYKGLGMEISVGGRMLNLHFDPAGNFVNRDYNENFNEFECEAISPTVIMEIFRKSFYKILKKNTEEPLLYGTGGKYFTDEFCIIPYSNGHGEFGFEMVPLRYDKKSYQHNSGDTIYKKPTKVQFRTLDELYNDLLSRLSPLEKCLLSDNYAEHLNYVQASVETKND